MRISYTIPKSDSTMKTMVGQTFFSVVNICNIAAVNSF